MKFQIQFKDPDGVYDCIAEASEEEARKRGLSSDKEKAAVQEVIREEMQSFSGKWLEYDEYCTLEFDTEAGTAVVVPRR